MEMEIHNINFLFLNIYFIVVFSKTSLQPELFFWMAIILDAIYFRFFDSSKYSNAFINKVINSQQETVTLRSQSIWMDR